jgi:hypothetical protein
MVNLSFPRSTFGSCRRCAGFFLSFSVRRKERDFRSRNKCCFLPSFRSASQGCQLPMPNELSRDPFFVQAFLSAVVMPRYVPSPDLDGTVCVFIRRPTMRHPVIPGQTLTFRHLKKNISISKIKVLFSRRDP